MQIFQYIFSNISVSSSYVLCTCLIRRAASGIFVGSFLAKTIMSGREGRSIIFIASGCSGKMFFARTEADIRWVRLAARMRTAKLGKIEFLLWHENITYRLWTVSPQLSLEDYWRFALLSFWWPDSIRRLQTGQLEGPLLYRGTLAFQHQALLKHIQVAISQM